MPGLLRPCPLETEQWHIALADCTRGSESLNRPYTTLSLLQIDLLCQDVGPQT